MIKHIKLKVKFLPSVISKIICGLGVIIIVVLFVSPGLLLAQAVPDWKMVHYVDRYYHANNAVSGSQLLGIPMPFIRGKEGDWRFSVAPAYVRVSAEPVDFRGWGLNLAYCKRISDRWGLYAVLFTNRIKTRSTSSSGSPHEFLLRPSFTGLDGTPSYSGSFPSGGSIFTIAEFLALSYTIREDPNRWPITVFGGPVFTQSFSRDLIHNNVFTGTYSGGAKSYRMDLNWQGQFNFYFFGGALGIVTEKNWKKFQFVPHVVGGLFIYNRHSSRYSVQVHENFDSGASFKDTVYGNSWSGTVGENILGVKMLGFLIPGLDIIYRDWALGINIIEPLGGIIARNFPARYVLHGAWPFSIRLTHHFGSYEK